MPLEVEHLRRDPRRLAHADPLVPVEHEWSLFLLDALSTALEEDGGPNIVGEAYGWRRAERSARAVEHTFTRAYSIAHAGEGSPLEVREGDVVRASRTRRRR